jgi:hypothetical protein
MSPETALILLSAAAVVITPLVAAILIRLRRRGD